MTTDSGDFAPAPVTDQPDPAAPRPSSPEPLEGDSRETIDPGAEGAASQGNNLAVTDSHAPDASDPGEVPGNQEPGDVSAEIAEREQSERDDHRAALEDFIAEARAQLESDRRAMQLEMSEMKIAREQDEKRIRELEAQLRQAAPDTGKVANIPPMKRAGDPGIATGERVVSPDMEDVVSVYSVTFTGPDADKWAQPIEVEALPGCAVQRVVDYCGLVAHAHHFNAIRKGKTFLVRVKSDNTEERAAFPTRRVAASTPSSAIAHALRVTPLEPEHEHLKGKLEAV